MNAHVTSWVSPSCTKRRRGDVVSKSWTVTADESKYNGRAVERRAAIRALTT